MGIKPYADTVLAMETNYHYDFTFAWTTDPQNLVKYRPELHIQNIKWLADNKDILKLKYVINSGDLVCDNDAQQWADSDTAQKLLDNAGIPNGVLAGNHDTGGYKFENYCLYYNECRYKNNNWYGGSYTNQFTSNFGHFDLVTECGVDFLMVYMSSLHTGDNAPLPTEDYKDAMLADQIKWLNAVLKRYPNHRTILILHEYLGSSKTGKGSNTDGRLEVGQKYFDEVVAINENVFMVLCGHKLGTWRQEVHIGNRVVHEILYNYQGQEAPDGNGGPRYRPDTWGMIRLLQFNKEENIIHFRTYSPICDSSTIYDTTTAETPAPKERDQFTIPFDFNTAM